MYANKSNTSGFGGDNGPYNLSPKSALDTVKPKAGYMATKKVANHSLTNFNQHKMNSTVDSTSR